MPFIKKTYGKNYKKRYNYRRKPYGNRYGGNKLALRKSYYKSPTSFFIARWSKGRAWAKSISPPAPAPGWPVDSAGNYRVIWQQYQFNLRDVVGSTDFENLFRFYKIHKVVCRLSFSWDGAGMETNEGQQTTAQQRPWQNFSVYSLIDKGHSRDWEDLNVPQPPVQPQNTLFNAKQFNNFRCHTTKANITRVCKPQSIGITQEDGQPAAIEQPAVSQTRRTWYMTKYPNTTFWGLVFGVRPVYPVSQTLNRNWAVQYMTDVKYYLEFRGTQ